jgi:hypothetical protein
VGEIAINEPTFDARGDSNYQPCAIGLHICGSAGNPEQPYTAANLPATSQAKARKMFAAAMREAACEQDEADFVCDLNLGAYECQVEDFWTNRQLLPRLFAAALKDTPQ